MGGVLFLEGGSGSFAVICPFPRVSLVPSGLCSGGLKAGGGGGAGMQMQTGERGGGEEEGGTGESKSLFRASGLDWKAELLRHHDLLSLW